MKTARFFWTAALLLAIAGAARAVETAPDSPPSIAAVYTRQGVFSIPFRIDGLAAGGPQPAEVRLYVSEDQGGRWKSEVRVKPDQQSFGFRAPHDGDYWFSIRTIDAQGQSHPDGPYEAQLRVIVDTITPRLDLSASRGAGGEIVARWHVLDTGLKADSFKLEYQASSEGQWLPLAIDAQLQHVSKYTLIGEATWWPPEASGAMILRATAADEAGNSAVSQVQIKTDRTTRADPPGGRTAQDRSASEGPAGSRPLQWPADTSTDQTLARSVPGAADRQTDTDAAWRAANRDPQLARDPLGRDRSGWPRTPAQTVAQTLPPAGAAQEADWSAMPLGERPRMVNLKTFELDYEVDAVGSSGVARVELWGTRDGGRHWASFGADNDNRSPLVVTVDGEGLYGFRIVIQSGNGLSGQPPRDGDLPEVWIGVDLTKPLARITAIEPGLEGGELAVRWETSDALPENRPVSLFYSDQPHGPWTPIAAGLENSGSFTWRLDNRVPERIFLRLEARDEAGNMGAYETPDPVSLDRQRPQGRIRGVRPVGQSAR